MQVLFNMIYVITISLQFTGLMMLAFKVMKINRTTITKILASNSVTLNMSSFMKPTTNKKKYISTAREINNLKYGTIYTVLGFLLGLMPVESTLNVGFNFVFMLLISIALYLIFKLDDYLLVKKLNDDYPGENIELDDNAI